VAKELATAVYARVPLKYKFRPKTFHILKPVRLMEMPMAIDIHILPRPLPRVDLYFDGTRITRSYAAFGGSYAPGIIHCNLVYPEPRLFGLAGDLKIHYYACAEGVTNDLCGFGYGLSDELYTDSTGLPWPKLTDQSAFLNTAGHDHTV
jgi:hypothetical protein